MDEFLEDLGFKVADNVGVSIGIAAICSAIALFIAYRAIRDDEQVKEYRVLAVALAVVLVGGLAAGLPYVHAQASDACDRWARSASPVDELAYLRNECAARF